MILRLKLTYDNLNRTLLKGDKILLIAAFFAIYFIWGSTYLGIKIAIKTIPPFLMASSRYFIAGTIMLIAAWFFKSGKPTLVNLKENAILGFAMLLLGNGGVVLASSYLPSGIIALMVAIEPIWVVLLVYLGKQGKAPGAITLAGIVLGFAGSFLLLFPLGTGGMQVDGLAFVVLFLSTLSWAIGSLYAVKANNGVPALLATSLQMLSASVYMLIAGTLTGEWNNIHPENFTGESLAAFAYLILFGSIAGYTAYTYLLKVAKPQQVATHAYVNPLIAVILGSYMGNETFTMQMAIAALLLISGVILVMVKGKE